MGRNKMYEKGLLKFITQLSECEEKDEEGYCNSYGNHYHEVTDSRSGYNNLKRGKM